MSDVRASVVPFNVHTFALADERWNRKKGAA